MGTRAARAAPTMGLRRQADAAGHAARKDARLKVVILAGGLGTRLAEETEVRPKPMVEIGGRPILWHILKIYHHYGYRDFVIALGYKGEHIKRWLVEYCSYNGNLTVNARDGEITRHGGNHHEDWTIELVDTGLDTATGGRIKRLAPYIGDQPFMLTWGDGVADIDVDKLVAFHRAHGRLATVTAVRPPARFGRLDLEGDLVRRFSEKPQLGEGWINGAFFVLEPGVLDYVEGDGTVWEGDPLAGGDAPGRRPGRGGPARGAGAVLPAGDRLLRKLLAGPAAADGLGGDAVHPGLPVLLVVLRRAGGARAAQRRAADRRGAPRRAQPGGRARLQRRLPAAPLRQAGRARARHRPGRGAGAGRAGGRHPDPARLLRPRPGRLPGRRGQAGRRGAGQQRPGPCARPERLRGRHRPAAGTARRGGDRGPLRA